MPTNNMLVLSIQNEVFSKSKTGNLLALLASKISDISIRFIQIEDIPDFVAKSASPVLYITQDAKTGADLNRQNVDIIVWKDLSDLAHQLDVFLQLKRHTAQFPLSLKKWRLKEVLHNSNNAIIYRAENKQGETVAIKRFKFLPSGITDEKIERLLNRVKKHADTRSKGLVKFYEGGICDNAFYLVMEYLKYGTLRQTLDGCGNILPLNHALSWFQEIALALDSVHQLGFIHRDVKLANILMRADGSLALTDYGISKRILLEAGYMYEHELRCSPHYVSPEQIKGEACTKASDIYSLGVIFYELLTGKKPYSADQAFELMMHHVMAAVPQLPAEFCEFQTVLDKLMAKNPDDRYPSAIDAIGHSPVAA